jgi:Mg2+/Co2+ transporter CorB
MFRAIGTVIVLLVLSNLFSNSFVALDSAATESFKALEAAAIASQNQLENI